MSDRLTPDTTITTLVELMRDFICAFVLSGFFWGALNYFPILYKVEPGQMAWLRSLTMATASALGWLVITRVKNETLKVLFVFLLLAAAIAIVFLTLGGGW